MIAQEPLWPGGPTLEHVWQWLGTSGLQILVTVVGAVVLRWLIVKVISRAVRDTIARAERSTGLTSRASRVLAQATGLAAQRHEQRTRTMGSLLRSIVTVVVVTVAALTVMSIVGIPMGPLLASAGVGGVALGFGAQSLVKDFLSGVFMIMEDQYGVGDLVDLGDITGTVEEVGLRVTRLRDPSGVVWYVRNGEIVQVANRSQGWSTALVDVQVGVAADVEEAIATLRDVVHEMDQAPQWQEVLLEEPKVLGVEQVSATGVTLRILAKCVTDEHWGVQREIRRRAKEALDARGIQGPAVAGFDPGI